MRSLLLLALLLSGPATFAEPDLALVTDRDGTPLPPIPTDPKDAERDAQYYEEKARTLEDLADRAQIPSEAHVLRTRAARFRRIAEHYRKGHDVDPEPRRRARPSDVDPEPKRKPTPIPVLPPPGAPGAPAPAPRTPRTREIDVPDETPTPITQGAVEPPTH